MADNHSTDVVPTVKTLAERVQHPRWGVICMVLSIVFFSVNSLTLKFLSQSNISPWVALLFRASVGMVVVATVFRSDKGVNFKRAMTDRLLAGRGLLGILGTVAYYFTIPELGAGQSHIDQQHLCRVSRVDGRLVSERIVDQWQTGWQRAGHHRSHAVSGIAFGHDHVRLVRGAGGGRRAGCGRYRHRHSRTYTHRIDGHDLYVAVYLYSRGQLAFRST